MKNWEINGTEEIGLVTPTPVHKAITRFAIRHLGADARDLTCNLNDFCFTDGTLWLSRHNDFKIKVFIKPLMMVTIAANSCEYDNEHICHIYVILMIKLSTGC